jgi:enoyl-CoA hydratase/carnithine racemase
VNCSKHEGVLVLELSNPPANTYSYEMMRHLDAHVLDARMDESIHVLMITELATSSSAPGRTSGCLREAPPTSRTMGRL